MTADKPAAESPLLALDADTVARAIRRIAHEIAERNGTSADTVLIGILRRGVSLAQRLATELNALTKQTLAVGTLDISFYRDDGRGDTHSNPQLLSRDIPFTLDGRKVVLVDDVLYTGRTVRAALDAIADLGRPECVQLAVLVDRGERELPIRADYVGKNVKAPAGQRVYVRLQEVDGVDAVVVGGSK